VSLSLSLSFVVNRGLFVSFVRGGGWATRKNSPPKYIVYRSCLGGLKSAPGLALGIRIFSIAYEF
jgi:hypothetical protein